MKDEKEEWKTVSDERLAAQEQHHQEAMQAQQQRFEEMMAKVQAQLKSATDDMLRATFGFAIIRVKSVIFRRGS